MATAGLRAESSRELLSRIIVESLKSWPELQRQIFIDIHYRGRSVADVSRSLGRQQAEVAEILRQCQGKLYKALKAFRDQTSGEMPQEPPHSLAYAANGLE
jgi:DNA-directed RNA polymerase specialized sigma24 family protein